MSSSWTWTDADAATAASLQARLPRHLFDAHAHSYRIADLGQPTPALPAAGPPVCGSDVWRAAVGRQVGIDRLAGGLLIPYPTAACDADAANRFMVEVLADTPDCRGLLLVRPGQSRETIETLLADHGERIAGFKPYHLMGTFKPSFDAPISAYLPEWAWELAHRDGRVITLHMVREKALSDPLNQKEIREHCQRFPGAHLILAHAARGFHAPNTLQGLASVRNLPNLWFDASGICEPAALRAIIETVGPRRLMWGSDFPVSEQRGRCVTIGDGFAWINPERIDNYPTAPALRTWPAGLENLNALLTAADDCGLNETDREDLFCENARRVLGLDRDAGTRTQDAYRKARTRIPGGTHLLSKRPELFAPGQWPAYFSEARGCEIWDLDHRRYIDWSINGVGACLLGYADPDVGRAVRRRVLLGNLCSLNPVEELELADRLCALHPWASRVRLARTGGEMAAVAVRIARATTDRSAVAICGYHGWHDWYLAANLGDDDSLRGHLLPGLNPLGVPRELRGTAFTFAFNDRDALRRIVETQGDRLAAVIMEPCRARDPEPGFLEWVRQTAHAAGALLIFDEITIGFRLAAGGAHLRFGVTPDMALFGKSLGNGFPIAALIGTSEAMEGAQTSFISSSYWTDGIGPAAALATLDKLDALDVRGHVARIGSHVQQAWREAATRHGLPITVQGYPCVPFFSIDHPKAAALKTLYTQAMLDRGYLASPMVYITAAHDETVLEPFAVAIDEVFADMANAIEANDIETRLRGPVCHGGFQRLI